jgi:hypothetical protein
MHVMGQAAEEQALRAMRRLAVRRVIGKGEAATGMDQGPGGRAAIDRPSRGLVARAAESDGAGVSAAFARVDQGLVARATVDAGKVSAGLAAGIRGR